MNGLESMLLRIDGMPQQTIDEIEKATPSLAALIKMAREEMPTLQKIAALATEALPSVSKLAPLVAPAMAELNDILPAAQDVLAFLNSQGKNSAASPPAPGDSKLESI